MPETVGLEPFHLKDVSMTVAAGLCRATRGCIQPAQT